MWLNHSYVVHMGQNCITELCLSCSCRYGHMCFFPIILLKFNWNCFSIECRIMKAKSSLKFRDLLFVVKILKFIWKKKQFMRKMQMFGFYVATKSQNVIVPFFQFLTLVFSSSVFFLKKHNNLFNFRLYIASVVNFFVHSIIYLHLYSHQWIRPHTHTFIQTKVPLFLAIASTE